MIRKSLLHILTMGFIAVALTACGGKGVDRKLDYSKTGKELGESYDEALKDATPEQQNILRERRGEMLEAVLSLAANSNPATVEANAARKNAEEFHRLSKMSVRELFVEKLSERQNQLNSIIPRLDKIENGDALKVESIEIKDVRPKKTMQYENYIHIDGVIFMRNDSDDYSYDFRGCELAMVLDGKKIDEFQECGNSVEEKNIKSKGGKENFQFKYHLYGEENIKKFHDLLESNQMQKIAWRFKHSYRSYIISNDRSMAFEAGGSGLKKLKDELQQVTADLAVLKK